MLLTFEGFQVPVIELLEVVGKTGALPPTHIAAGVVNVGVVVGVTVTLKFLVVAHNPAVGVNV